MQASPSVSNTAGLLAVQRDNVLYLKRNLELGDMLLGYEQARQMLVMDGSGRPLLALAEQQGSVLGGTLARQLFDRLRAFTIDIVDAQHHTQSGGDAEQAHGVTATDTSRALAGSPSLDRVNKSIHIYVLR